MKVTRIIMLVAATMIYGCSTVGDVSNTAEASDSTPVGKVTAALAKYHEALKTSNVEQAVAAYSDDFANSEGGNKSVLYGYFAQGASMGAFKGITIVMDKCEFTVDGDFAVAKPVIYSSAQGSSSYQFRFKKEADGKWRIVNTETIK
jgi:ketosteroid isomerase-like protein